jgi:predicted metal-binding membrane protein
VAAPRRVRQALSEAVKSQRVFLGVSALLFVASAALTIVWCTSMSGMGHMTMPGGWTMSMTWMQMPGQTWPRAAASFIGMWIVIMVAMMLTALAGIGYFFVWTMVGIAAFPLGMALASVAMQQPALARAVPAAIGAVVLLGGAVQFTAWKAHHLACCREAPGRGCTLPAAAAAAWRYGLRLGVHCGCSCVGLTMILLVIGVMDMRAMAAVTTAVSVEHLAPAGERIARAIGTVVVATGLLLIARGTSLV